MLNDFAGQSSSMVNAGQLSVAQLVGPAVTVGTATGIISDTVTCKPKVSNRGTMLYELFELSQVAGKGPNRRS
jgi:hypothetical protein